MKPVFFFLFIFFNPFRIFSQDTIIRLNQKVLIQEDSTIADLVSKYKSYNAKKEVADGYRVQIMYTDIREEAYKVKAVLYKEFPEIKSYVEYEQPYFKVRVGDFKTRLDATAYLQKIIPLYTGAFIVRDKIKIK